MSTLPLRPLSLALAVSVVLSAGAYFSFRDPAQPAVAEARADAGPHAANVVRVPPGFGAEIRVEAVRTAPIRDTLRVAGRVDFDEHHVSRIGATVTGRVTEISARIGQNVRVGETLAVINSTELGEAQLAYLKARAQAGLQAQNVERARQLFAADVIGRAELQRREAELAIASAEQRGAADQLKVLGMSSGAIQRLGTSGAINSVSTVNSTMAGTVVEREVAQGQVVQPADALFVVANLARIWVTAEVPEQQAALVKEGQTVEIEVPALDTRLKGTLIFVADTVNPQTRTVTVRSEVDNTARQLKPAMLATMLIQARPVERPVVPAPAVVRENNADHVFVELSPRIFKLVPVKLGQESAGQRPVVSGVAPGQRVLVAGAFHLNNERKRKELE